MEYRAAPLGRARHSVGNYVTINVGLVIEVSRYI